MAKNENIATSKSQTRINVIFVMHVQTRHKHAKFQENFRDAISRSL